MLVDLAESDSRAMSIDPRRVNDLYVECLGEGDGIAVEGVVVNAVFDKMKLATHQPEIANMLDELPVEFRSDAGGGWSFLNACLDKNGAQWTGEHRTMERLFMLGMGIGIVSYLLPRDVWSALPGGMPYVQIHPRSEATKW